MKNERKVGNKIKIAGSCLIFLSIICLIFLFFSDQGYSEDIKLTSYTHNSGLKCENDSIVHPVLTDFSPQLFKNTISAVFSEDVLSSISFQYQGLYDSSETATSAKAFAAADYNTILAKEYGLNPNIFSHSSWVNEKTFSLTITAQGGDIPQKAAPYFLLDGSATFPTSKESMRNAYVNKGFLCQEV